MPIFTISCTEAVQGSFPTLLYSFTMTNPTPSQAPITCSPVFMPNLKILLTWPFYPLPGGCQNNIINNVLSGLSWLMAVRGVLGNGVPSPLCLLGCQRSIKKPTHIWSGYIFMIYSYFGQVAKENKGQRRVFHLRQSLKEGSIHYTIYFLENRKPCSTRSGCLSTSPSLLSQTTVWNWNFLF